MATKNVSELPDGPPDATGLTPRQQRVLATIKDSIEKRGYPPSMREIGEAVGLTSSSSVAHQLKVLEEKGFLKRDPNRPRALEVFLPEVMAARRSTRLGRGVARSTRPASATPLPPAAYVPLLGRIAAGGPILAEESLEEVFPLPKTLVGDGQLFLLEVRGDSMIDAAICDGDYVVIRQQQTAENGEIVAALLDGRGHGQDLPAQGRQGLAAPPQRRLRADRRHPRHHPRQGHRGPAPRLTPTPLRVRSGVNKGRTRCRDPPRAAIVGGVTIVAPHTIGLDKLDRRSTKPARRRWRLPARGLRELLLITALYVAYSATRLVADDALAPAVDRAHALVDVEIFLGLHWEQALNRLFVDVGWLGLVGSYWYATAHYVVTAVVLVWLYRRGPATYAPARRALLIATVAGLVLYLLLPMAPPRLTGGYVDVLALNSADGWWGSEASAPRGLGGFTNQLAAFPSLHAGWALWVALAIRSATSNRVARAFGWTHAIVTAIVVVGTGNHWVLDAVAGWLVVGIGLDSRRGPGGGRPICAKPQRDQPTWRPMVRSRTHGGVIMRTQDGRRRHRHVHSRDGGDVAGHGGPRTG